MLIRNRGLFLIVIALLFSVEANAQSTTGSGKAGPLLFAGNKPKDVTPPTIEILEPVEIGQRGMKVVAEKGMVVSSSSIRIRGVSRDSAGVAIVRINDQDATVTPLVGGCEFEREVLLSFGTNAIDIRAIDKNNNSAQLSFKILREVSRTGPSFISGKYYALIVGIDKYGGEWSPLKNAVHDAKGLEKLLNDEFRFDKILTLFDREASRTRIIQQLEWLVANVDSADNLLIYFSGHGEFKDQLRKGYWVPVDAKERSTMNLISNSDIQTFLNGIRSKHTLLISDACFAGDIFRGATERIPFENNERYFKEVYRRISRQAITSGGNEPVTDGGKEGHSVFTYYLLKSLREREGRYFDAGQVFEQLKIPVSNNSDQTPVFQAIKNTGDEGGQFIFVRKK